MITLEQANDMYRSLNAYDQMAVKKILMGVRQQYVLSGINVDVPYFFYSIHKPMFDDGEEKDFLEIKDSKIFAINAIYYISRFIIRSRSRQGTTNEKT